MSKLIVANWKMNPATEAEARELARAIDAPGVVICPPFPFLKAVAEVIKKSRLGAQDLFWAEQPGPYTGEVSAAELKDMCVEYVIIGHSERRENLKETDEMIAKKLAAALHSGLIPILCVGESWKEKEAGRKEEIVARELRMDLSELDAKNGVAVTIYIAYEPIWAISTAKQGVRHADKPEDTIAMIGFIKQELKKLGVHQNVKFIYGGSVNPHNAEAFLAPKEIEGALVGGASLKPEEFKVIVASAS